MNYGAAISDFFRSSAWVRNLLLNAVCLIIPVVGMVVLHGWHVTALWGPRKNAEAETLEPFRFEEFGVYLERGLWPTLVSIVGSLALMMVAAVVWFLPMILVLQVPGIPRELRVVFAVVLVGGGYAVLLAAMNLVLSPMVIRATLRQDFAQAFDVGFVREFLRNTWREALMVLVCLILAGVVLMVLTVVTCYVGGILGTPVLLFAWQHWQKQLYEVHLARGGTPVERSPKLPGVPPPLPA